MNSQESGRELDWIPPEAVAGRLVIAPPGPATEHSGLITSRSQFHEALRDAFARAASQGCRELWLCDQNFADWPLGDPEVIDDLTRWGYAHRKLRLFAFDFEEITRRHPRFVTWRRHWSHIVEARQLDEIEASQVPTLLLAPGLVTVRLLDAMHYRGTASGLESDAQAARELLTAVAERSHEAFPASTLGL